MDKKSALSRKPKPKNQNSHVDAFIDRGLKTSNKSKPTIDNEPILLSKTEYPRPSLLIGEN